jgi:hypothetical protein
MLYVSLLTKKGNVIKFWLDHFYVHDLKKGKLIIVGGILDPNDNLYKLCDTTQLDSEPSSLVSHINERSLILHE